MIRDVEAGVHGLDKVLVAKEFPDVFPKELLVTLLEKKVKFCIDLALGVQYVSIPPYRMALVNHESYWISCKAC